MSYLIVSQHISIANDGHGKVLGNLLHQAPVRCPLVALLHGAAMNGDGCCSCILQCLSHLYSSLSCCNSTGFAVASSCKHKFACISVRCINSCVPCCSLQGNKSKMLENETRMTRQTAPYLLQIFAACRQSRLVVIVIAVEVCKSHVCVLAQYSCESAAQVTCM